MVLLLIALLSSFVVEAPQLHIYTEQSHQFGGLYAALDERGVPYHLASDDDFVQTGGVLQLESTDATAARVEVLAVNGGLPSDILYVQPEITPILPADSEALLGVALYAAGNCEAAFPLLDDLPFFAGNCAVMLGDYAAAIAAYERTSGGFRASVNLTWTYATQGETEQALELLEDTLGNYSDIETASTDEIEYLRVRAALFALLFEFDAAIDNITQAIVLAEAEEASSEQVATLYKQRGDHIFLIYEWDRVLADYNAAIARSPGYADAHFARGVLYYTQGPRSLALEDFREFIRLAPNDERVSQAQDYIESIEAELAALEGDDTGSFGPSD